MAFRTLDFLDMPPDALVTSPDGRRMAGSYVAHHEEDRYRELTYYHVSVWDLDTEELVARFVRSHEVDHETREVDGAPVVGVAFSDDGTELVIRTCGRGAHDTVQEEREPLP